MADTILIVEDEAAIAGMVKETLASEGYASVRAATCAEGWRLFESQQPALVILDVGLPDGSGVDLCRRMRAHLSLGATPVIMLTGNAELSDKKKGFDSGADHYLVKPIRIAELHLWVSALLTRVNASERAGGVVRRQDFVVDPSSHTVTAGGDCITDLTRREFELLYELVRQSPRVVSKEHVMKSLWNAVLRDNTIEVHIRNIRAKLRSSAGRIITIPGAGYRFQ